MAKLFYFYGTMNAQKSSRLLSSAHAYTETHKKVLLMNSCLDTKVSSNNEISSRIGISEKVDLSIDSSCNIFNFVGSQVSCSKDRISAIFIDEVQFLSPKQVEQLADIVDKFNIPVLAYGLKTDFSGKLFPASQRLLELADDIREMKAICWFCSHKAILNLRLDSNNSQLIDIGGNSKYVPVCRKCFNKHLKTGNIKYEK